MIAITIVTGDPPLFTMKEPDESGWDDDGWGDSFADNSGSKAPKEVSTDKDELKKKKQEEREQRKKRQEEARLKRGAPTKPKLGKKAD